MKALCWTQARLLYENDVRYDAFEEVCRILSEEYSFTSENVDSIVKKVKETEQNGIKNAFRSGIPTGRSDNSVRDSEVLEIYRIRNWCVRFIQPNVNYTYINIDEANPEFKGEEVDMIYKNRTLFAQFVEFMENEYAKAYSTENSPTILKGRDTQVMEFLRKMLELPY